MLIERRRIRNLERYLGFLNQGQQLVLGIGVNDVPADLVTRIGFSPDLVPGEQVLPVVSGPVSRFNAEGKYLVHRDQPKETAYRQIQWSWEQYCGRDQTETVTQIVDVPYQRYPRTFVAPPGLELSLANSTDGSLLVVSPPFTVDEGSQQRILHGINLFLELFRRCEVMTVYLERVIRAPQRRLNWRVLPPGRRPWERLREDVDPIISRAPEGNQPVIRHRLEVVNRYQPEFYAIGQGGFSGYIVFGFPTRGLFVLESIYAGNATYVFGHDWETLSQMSKAEILSGQLELERLVHREAWPTRVQGLLGA